MAYVDSKGRQVCTTRVGCFREHPVVCVATSYIAITAAAVAAL